MQGTTAKAIVWVGTPSSLINFPWLTYDFHQQEHMYAKTDKISEQVVAGKKAWYKYNCNDCHTILGFGAYYAPDMTKAYFRALEPLPIALMVLDTWMHIKERNNPIVNPLLWTYIMGLALFHCLGAGVFGFIHTLPAVNYYTHGSQITVSHGHLAFFGAYALLNLVVFYFALPKLKGIEKFDERLGVWGFWTMVIAMVFMGLIFGVAGILQTYLERILDIGNSTAHMSMMFWFKSVLFFGVFFLAGVLMTVYHLFTLKKVSV